MSELLLPKDQQLWVPPQPSRGVPASSLPSLPGTPGFSRRHEERKDKALEAEKPGLTLCPPLNMELGKASPRWEAPASG